MCGKYQLVTPLTVNLVYLLLQVARKGRVIPECRKLERIPFQRLIPERAIERISHRMLY